MTNTMDHHTSHTLDKVYTDFMIRTPGLGPTAPHPSLKHELGYIPPSSRMLQQILTFRHNILMRPDNDLVRIALIENIDLANDNPKLWSSQLQRILSRDTSSLPSSLTSPLTHLDPDLALREREEKLDAALNGAAAHLGLLHPNTSIHSLPDNARKGFKALKYLKWCKPLTPAPDPKTQLRAGFLPPPLQNTHTHHCPASNEQPTPPQ
jgi:hypothetical protein